MLYDRILVKYGELTLKGKNKINFINHINRTIKEKCKKFPQLEYVNHYERFYIILNGVDYKLVMDRLNTIFGLHSYCLVAKCKSELEEIKKLSARIISEEITEKTTFKVETKRADKTFPLTSIETSKEVASYVLKNNNQYLIVDVKKPQVTLNIEIRHEGTYIYTKEIFGLGGLPVGMDGKGLLMLSGGIDSPVAGYLIQKRGVGIDVIHFASPPYTSIKAKQKVLELAEKLAHYSQNDKITIFNIPFTKLQKAINDHCPHNYTITIMRRMMYRISERVAKKYNCSILISGESIGQVASQTLQSLYVINNVTNMPVIRPVATMDKKEIVDIAQKINTYDISIRPYEDCCTIFVPKNPVINPDLGRCLEYEKLFDYEAFIDECIKNMEIINIQAGEVIELKDNEEFLDLF